MPTALFSVSDKTHLVDLAHGLEALGWDFLASGGTARTLREAGNSVTEVAEYTGSPEILGGRVKTLHPAVAGGLLARDTQADHQDLERIQARPISLVAVNLYPFLKAISKPQVSLDEAIENIDIGGVTLIRAAAKNYARVIVLIDPGDYKGLLAELKSEGECSLETRKRLAIQAFNHCAAYDAAITSYLSKGMTRFIELHRLMELRYGENPHQTASLFTRPEQPGPLGGRLLQGKQLSYNNLLDLDAAWRAALNFERPTVCIVKHLSPCGIACADTLAEAYPLALASDPVSAFGSVIAVNRPFDLALAKALTDLFVECIAAPSYTEDAQSFLAEKDKLRIVEMGDTKVEPLEELRSINQGYLIQDVDQGDPQGSAWRSVTDREPSDEEWKALRFAWKACQHVKSNAIVFAQGEATVGIGGGQPNRVDCVHIAAQKAGQKSKVAVMASDAFFPFPDAVEVAAEKGITAIVQPGGSIRDQDSVDACNQHGIAMVLTGVRHFRH